MGKNDLYSVMLFCMVPKCSFSNFQYCFPLVAFSFLSGITRELTALTLLVRESLDRGAEVTKAFSSVSVLFEEEVKTVVGFNCKV